MRILRDWWAWAGLGAIGGALVLRSKKYGIRRFGPKPRAVLSVHRPSKLPVGWESALGAFDAISFRLLNPGITTEKALYYEIAASHGLAAHGWGYHYLNSKDQAGRELGRLEQQIPKYGIKCYWVNAEKQFWAAHDRPGLIDYFAQQFRARFPGVGLAWNGYAISSKAGVSASDKATIWGPEWIRRNFDVWGPMCYGSKEGGRTTFNKIMGAVAAANAAGVISAPTITVGEVCKGYDGKGPGEHWGYTFGPYGVAAAFRAAPFDWINFWHGEIPGRSTLLAGNTKNPSMTEQLRAMREGDVGIA